MDDATISQQLPKAIRDFLHDLLRDPALARLHDVWSEAFEQMDIKGDADANACGLMTAVEWVCKQPRPVCERLAVIVGLGELKGFRPIGR